MSPKNVSKAKGKNQLKNERRGTKTMKLSQGYQVNTSETGSRSLFSNSPSAAQSESAHTQEVKVNFKGHIMQIWSLKKYLLLSVDWYLMDNSN